FVLTMARGREMIFWQTARTSKQARPNVRVPSARAQGLTELEILVDVHERYAWKFTQQQVSTTKRPLPAGDYAVELNGEVVAAVERKSLQDLVGTLHRRQGQLPDGGTGGAATRRGRGGGPLLQGLRPHLRAARRRRRRRRRSTGPL